MSDDASAAGRGGGQHAEPIDRRWRRKGGESAGAKEIAMKRRRRVDELSAEHRRGQWSARVTEESNALDLPPKIFRRHDPKSIAASLKRSAEQSRRRKSSPFRSAMSMLTFYINRAGTNLPASQKRVLELAKEELRKQFGRASRHA